MSAKISAYREVGDEVRHTNGKTGLVTRVSPSGLVRVQYHTPNKYVGIVDRAERFTVIRFAR